MINEDNFLFSEFIYKVRVCLMLMSNTYLGRSRETPSKKGFNRIVSSFFNRIVSDLL